MEGDYDEEEISEGVEDIDNIGTFTLKDNTVKMTVKMSTSREQIGTLVEAVLDDKSNSPSLTFEIPFYSSIGKFVYLKQDKPYPIEHPPEHWEQFFEHFEQ